MNARSFWDGHSNHGVSCNQFLQLLFCPPLCAIRPSWDDNVPQVGGRIEHTDADTTAHIETEAVFEQSPVAHSACVLKWRVATAAACTTAPT